MKRPRQERCPQCRGTKRRLFRAPEQRLPNGRVVQSVPYWEDCTACGGTGLAS